MTSTNHKALVRAYMRDHGVKYTEALRALGSPASMSEHQPAKYMLLSWDQYDYFPDVVGTAFATMAEAKASAHEDGDVIVGGFFAPDVEGGALRWHSDPHGNASHRILDPIRGALWGNPIAWNDEPRMPNGWTRSWFQRFPTPSAAASAPGLLNGDVADGVNGDMFRFVNAEGALVTMALPYLSVEAAFSRFTGHSALIHAEMERITGELDPRLGISLREAGTPVGQVRYWEFVTPKLASFVSWSSVDRYEDARLEALDAWINDEFPHTGSLNALPFAALETCEHCDDEPITRRHPLAPGSMIGPMCDFESVVEIGSPFGSDGPSTWEELLLMHLYGGMQFVSHDGCAAYWSEEA